MLSDFRHLRKEINKMKKSKILVPAVALLALGVAASATGTVAWFAANTQVGAGGMVVNATVSKNLVITNSAQETWAATANATTTGPITLNPVSNAVKGAPSFFKIADNSDVDYNTGHAKNGAVIKAAFEGALVEGGNGNLVRMDTFYIKLDAADTEHVNLKLTAVAITRAAGASEISKAVRVLVVTEELKEIYSVSGADASVDALSSAGTVANQNAGFSITAYKNADSEALTTPTEVGSLTEGGDLIKSDLAGGSETEVKVYTWYEGQDKACISNNSMTVENLSISMTFGYTA